MASNPTSSSTAIVLITGGNQGIGFEIGSILADLPDYHIIIGSRNPENGDKAVVTLLSQNSSRSVSAVTIDVTSDASITAAVSRITFSYGRIDILINNAGSLFEDPVTPVISRDLFQKTYEVNVFGATLVTEAFLPLLEKSTINPTKIIFISSRMGSLGTRAEPTSHNNFPIYRSSKSALNMIMLHYAALYGKKGWKVNAIAPGFTKTGFGGFVKGGVHGDATGTYLAKAGTVQDASKEAVRYATAGPDGVNGTFSSKEGVLPW